MKKIIGRIKLQILPGKANPAPPIGPALGQKGLNIVEFCKQFNDRTKSKDPNMKLPVILTVYMNRSFSFVIKSPPVSDLIKKYVGVQKGSSTPGKIIIGNLKRCDLLKIANIKFSDMGLQKVGLATKAIEGTALSMGINIID